MINRYCQSVERVLFRYRAGLLWLGCLVAVTLMLGELLPRFSDGGDFRYALAEWLLNYGDGLVRRGLSGSLILWLAGVFGGMPGIWAWGLASLFAIALSAACVRLYRALPGEPALVLLILSPFGLLFPAYDPGGSLRKEIIGFLAIALVLQGILSAGRGAAFGWAFAGVGLYGAGMFMHEGLLFLWPAFAGALMLVGWRWQDPKRFAALAAFSAVLAATAFGILAVQPVRDPQVMCDAAGLPNCLDAFQWLSKSSAEGVAYVFARRDWIDVPITLAILALGLLPFLGLRLEFGLDRGVRWKWGYVALAIGFTLPLYIVGYDWGRWTQMALFPASLLAVGAIIAGGAQYRRPFPALLTLVYLGSFSLSHAHARLEPHAFLLWVGLGGLVAVHAILRAILRAAAGARRG